MQEEDVIKLYEEMTPGITARVARWLFALKVRENTTQQAEDIVEDAFEMVLRAIRRNVVYTYSDKSFIWFRVRKALYNFMQDRMRRGIVRSEEFEDHFESEEKSVFQQIEEEESRQAVLQHLPPGTDTIIKMLEEGYSYKESRAATDKSPGAFRTLIYRLRSLFS